MRHTFTPLGAPTAPVTPSEITLSPEIEMWFSANLGLITLIIGFFGAGGAALFSSRVRKSSWHMLVFLWKRVVLLKKYIWVSTKRVAAWISDKWHRVATPLEDRIVISEKQKQWDSEREKLTSEVSQLKRLAEQRRQEVKTVANERDELRRQIASAKPRQISSEHLDKATPKSNVAENKVELEIRKQSDDSVFSYGGWVLRNWGPGTAYNVYLAAVDQNARVEQNMVKELSPQQEIVIYDSFSALPRFSSFLEPPQIRVSYENAAGDETVVFVPFPANMNGL